MVSNAAPTASSLSTTPATHVSLAGVGIGGNSNPALSTISMSLNIHGGNQGPSSSDAANTRNNDKGKKKLKGGLTLVYAADGEDAGEFSMEEMRAVLPRYQKILSRVSSIRNASM
jgi:hypothetical protein